MLFGVVDQIVYNEVVSCHLDDWIILRSELPVAIIIEDIKQSDSCVCKFLPSLQSNQ